MKARYTVTIEVSHVIEVESGSVASDPANVEGILSDLSEAYTDLLRTHDPLADGNPLNEFVEGYEVKATAKREDDADEADAPSGQFFIGQKVNVAYPAWTSDGKAAGSLPDVYFDHPVTGVVEMYETGDFLVAAEGGVSQWVSPEYLTAAEG